MNLVNLTKAEPKYLTILTSKKDIFREWPPTALFLGKASSDTKVAKSNFGQLSANLANDN